MNYREGVCAALTLFYPSDEQIENLVKYLDVFPELLIVDNTPTGRHEYIDKIKGYKKIHVLSLSENIGLSKGLNLICESAYNLNYKYCCVLDQDSTLDNNSIEDMISFINNFGSKVALFCPNIVYKHNNDNSCTSGSNDFKIVDWAITSGSFFDLDVFKIMNGFDENYFIDRLEIDYCLKAKACGFPTVQVSSVSLHQELGEPATFCGFKFYQHSPLRVYYQFRNRIYFYTEKKYSSKLFSYLKLILLSIRQILKIILIESKKKEKIMYILQAIKDGKYGKYGKYGKSD